MVERIAQHRHCKKCDRAIPYKDEFCDDRCENEWKGEMQSKKRQLIWFYGLMVIIMILAIGLMLLR